jgi:hypothetical protein
VAKFGVPKSTHPDIGLYETLPMCVQNCNSTTKQRLLLRGFGMKDGCVENVVLLAPPSKILS